MRQRARGGVTVPVGVVHSAGLVCECVAVAVVGRCGAQALCERRRRVVSERRVGVSVPRVVSACRVV